MMLGGYYCRRASKLERALNAEADYLSFNAMQTDDPIACVTLFKQLLNDGRKPKDEATAALG